MKDSGMKSPALAWAQWRYGIISPLLVCPPARGELGHRIGELAEQVYRHPLDPTLEMKVGASSIERWLYKARDAADPIAALCRKQRKDAGEERVMSEGLLAALKRQYQQYPGWSYQLHADNLGALVATEPLTYGELPSSSTIRRRMQSRGWFPKRKLGVRWTAGQRKAEERKEKKEIRSYEQTHVHALWHLDFHQSKRCRVVDAEGNWHTPMIFAVLDDHSRLCCHAQWYLGETAENLVHGLTQAFLKRGMPRALMFDNGGAMRAEETRNGLGACGVIIRSTLAYSPYQNGKQEKFWGTVEGRFLAMLEHVNDLRLAFLNRATQAWMEQEYNRRLHEEIGTFPLDRVLKGKSVGRASPGIACLRQRFSVRVTRKQRRSDGTVSLGGVRFEVPSRFRGQTRIYLRYRSWDLSSAWVVSPTTEQVLTPIYPLDKAKNADSRRRALNPSLEEPVETPPVDGDGIPPLMRQYLEEYAATGLPPAYLPKDERTLFPMEEECDETA